MLRKYVIKKSWPPFFELFSEKNMVQIWLILYHREMICARAKKATKS